MGEALNSMFRWYRDAELCLVYLADVEKSHDAALGLEQSVWFTRAWTLPELLAPDHVVFLSYDWQVLGHKGKISRGKQGLSTGPSLDGRIAAITKIPEAVLQDFRASRELSLEEKLSWMEGRSASREEDVSYSLLGILGVNMNIRYGEGFERTRARLLQKVLKKESLRAMPDIYDIQLDLDGVPTTDHFVSRGPEMQQLMSFCNPAYTSRQRRIVAMRGAAGTGKTQLCAEFVRKHHDLFSAVFWLHGSTKEMLDRSMASAALRLRSRQPMLRSERIELPADSSQLCNSFLQWLLLPDNTNWLLVIDDVDLPSQLADIWREFLQQFDHGTFLITTRSTQIPFSAVCLILERVDDNVAKEIVESWSGGTVQGQCTKVG